jgi:uncharacterized protein YgiM (DUF1202 family)
VTWRGPAGAGFLILAAALSACAPAPPPALPPAAAEAEPTPAPHAPDVRPIWVVKSDKTQLRDEPTTKSAVLGRLAKNTRVIGLDEKDGWVFVRLLDNRVGWIRADLLRKDDP